MIIENKIKDILKYVWYPQIDLQTDLKLLDDMKSSIFQILEDFGDVEKVSNFLKDISIGYYDGKISFEKCNEVAELMMSWYSVAAPIKTEYGMAKISMRGMYYISILYRNLLQDITIQLDMTMRHEAVLYPDKIPLHGKEKEQLLKAINELLLLVGIKILIYNDENSEYIENNLAYW